MFRLPDQSRFLRIAVVFSVFLLVAVLLGMMPAASPAVQGASFQRPSSIASRPLNLTLADVRPATAAAVGPIELLGPIELKPPLRPLSAGEPQTITLEIVPTTLIAHSGATAVVTATVVDLTGTPVSGVTLSGSITPTERGTLSGLSATDQDGKSVGTWTATALSTAGVGTVEVFTDTLSGSAPITLTADTPATVTLSAYPSIRTVGETSTLTATVVDQYSSPVDDGTIVTFTSDTGIVASPSSTSNGIATSTITSTQPGTAHITATSASRSGFASVIFNPHTMFLPILWRAVTDPAYGPWGVQMYDRLDASRGFDLATEAKVRWMRLRVSWFDIEPTNTTPNFYSWSALDQTVLAATFYGINLVVTLEGNPSWAAPTMHGPVNNLNNLKEFVGAMVERYPQVRYWELYNEPDNMYHFGGRGGIYAAHLNAVYPVIKSANPAAQLVMGGIALDWFTTEGGGFDPNFVNDMLRACVAPCFDVANFHYYPLFRARWETNGRDIIGKANAFRQMLAARGYVRPMLSTETGWVYKTNPGGDWGGPDIQGRYVPKAMIRGQAANLIMTNWYALTDADPTLPGLLGGTHPFQMRPSYTAMNRLITQLKAARFERALTSGEMGHQALEGYRYTQTTTTGATERIDVIWYDCPGLVVSTGSIPVDCLNAAAYSVPAPQATVYDHLSGGALVYTDGNDGVLDGKIKLFINRNPIYIHYVP